MVSSATAQEKPAYEQMSLEELLSVDISTATKTDVSLDETPVMAEVISAQQIRERGYRHLGDVLNDIVTNHVDRANWAVGQPLSQNSGFGFRFDTGQNILVLFNGQRLNAFIPGNRFGFEEYVLDNVERIEIIRGPGSALYGANAVTAVVNLISKTTMNPGEERYVRAAVGALPTSLGGYFDGSWKTRLGTKGFLSGALRIGGEQGQLLQVKNDLFGSQQLRDGVRYAIDGDLFFSYGRFRTYFKFDHQLRNAFTSLNSVSPSDDDRLRLGGYAYALGADYTHQPTDRVRLRYSAGIHLDSYTATALIPIFKTDDMGRLMLGPGGAPQLETVTVPRDGQMISTSFPIDGQAADTLTADAEVQVTWKYWRNNNLVVGVNLNYDQILRAYRPTEIQLSPPAYVEFQQLSDSQNNWLSDPSAGRLTIGTYAQIDFALGRQLFLNAGVRADVYTGTGALNQTYAAANPRVGVLWKNHIIGNVKALFGQATRIPNGYEALSTQTIQGDPGLRPEQISTFQASWDRSWGGVLSTEVGYFYSHLANHILTEGEIVDAERMQGIIARYRNVDTPLHSQGVLAKLTLRFDHFYVSGNFTRYFATQGEQGQELLYVPFTMLNLNVGGQLWWFRLNVGLNYRGDISKDAVAPVLDLRAVPAEYTLLNPTLWFCPPSFPLQVRVGVRNMLDFDVHYPSANQDYRNHFPGRRVEPWADVSYTLRF